MLTYLEFLNENTNNNDIEYALFCNAMAESQNEIDNKYAINFSEAAALRSFYARRDITEREISDGYKAFSDKMVEKGYGPEIAKRIYASNASSFEYDPAGFTESIEDPKYKNVNAYGAHPDKYLYEASNGKFLMGGMDLTEEDSDILIKYQYGWYNSSYGKQAINQQFGSLDKFTETVLTNSHQDMTFQNLYTNKDYEVVNPHYFISYDSYATDDMRMDGFYVFDIEGESHIVSYKKGIVDDQNNFKIVLQTAFDMFEEDVEEMKEFMKASKWPSDLAISFEDDSLNQLFKSFSGIKKFDL